MSHEKGVVTPKFMEEMASAINHTIIERLGEDIGFILVAVSASENGATQFQHISNITETDAIKEILTEIVTHDETKN